MSAFMEQLRCSLRQDGCGRVVVMGIGNPLRGDDAVGLSVIDHLELMEMDDVLLVRAESAPENFTAPIRDYEPTHVLMVDSAELNSYPGNARVIPLDAIAGSRISTHTSSLKTLISFIEKTTKARVALIGVQPLSMEFGTEMSPVVEAASKKVAYAIKIAINACRKMKNEG